MSAERWRGDNMRRLLLVFLLLLASPALALSVQDAPDYVPKMPPLPKVKGDALPWDIFLETKEQQKKVTFPSGGYSFDVTPIFTDRMKKLNGKEITLYGFMFPLEQSEKQANFLIGPFPPSCPFHYHIPPTLIVEVRTQKPIDFSWDEITLKGTLELTEKDPNGVYYILKDAEIVK